MKRNRIILIYNEKCRNGINFIIFEYMLLRLGFTAFLILFLFCFVDQVNVTADIVLVVAENLTVLTDDIEQLDDDNLEDISNILTDIVAVNDPSLNVSVKSYASLTLIYRRSATPYGFFLQH